MFKTILTACAVLGVSGGAALAADPGWSQPAYNWSGLYVGAFAGAVSGSQTGLGATPHSGPSGADIGVDAYYSWQTPSNWVFSPFVAVPFGGPSGSAAGSFDVRIDWSVLAGLKVGYAMDRWQPYGFIAGVIGGGSATSGSPESHSHSGFAAGVGLDYAWTDRWIVGLRYAHVSVGPQTYFGSFDVGFVGDSIAATVAFKLQ